MNHAKQMQNLCCLGIIAGLLAFTTISAFAETSVVERKQESVEIKAGEEMRIEGMKVIKPVEEIRPEGEEKEIPEIPKAIKREQLTAAVKVRLDELEQKRTTGKINETEYQLEKDSLLRESNIKF